MKPRCQHASPLGYRTYLVLYRTARMAPGVFLGHNIVDTTHHSDGRPRMPMTRTALKREIRNLKRREGWTKILGVWEECYRKVKL